MHLFGVMYYLYFFKQDVILFCEPYLYDGLVYDYRNKGYGITLKVQIGPYGIL